MSLWSQRPERQPLRAIQRWGQAITVASWRLRFWAPLASAVSSETEKHQSGSSPASSGFFWNKLLYLLTLHPTVDVISSSIPVAEPSSLYTDASSLTQDKISTVGYVLKDREENILTKNSKQLPSYKDSTQAEYESIIYALSEIFSHLDINRIYIYNDSQSAVDTVNPHTKHKARTKENEQYVQKIRKLLSNADKFKIIKIPRTENQLAHETAKNAIPPKDTLTASD